MSISVIGRAGDFTAAGEVRPDGRALPRSSTVPQARHSPQRPTHLVVSQPHSAQPKTGRPREPPADPRLAVEVLVAEVGVTLQTLGEGTDTAAEATLARRQIASDPDRAGRG